MAEDKEEKKGDGAGEKAQQMLAQAGQFGKDHWKAIGVIIAGITLVVVYLQYRNSLGATTSTTTTSTPPSDQTPVDTTLGNNPASPTTGGGAGGGPVDGGGSGPVYGGGGSGTSGSSSSGTTATSPMPPGEVALIARNFAPLQTTFPQQPAGLGPHVPGTTTPVYPILNLGSLKSAVLGNGSSSGGSSSSSSSPSPWGAKAAAATQPPHLSGLIAAGSTHFSVE